MAKNSCAPSTVRSYTGTARANEVERVEPLEPSSEPSTTTTAALFATVFVDDEVPAARRALTGDVVDARPPSPCRLAVVRTEAAAARDVFKHRPALFAGSRSRLALGPRTLAVLAMPCEPIGRPVPGFGKRTNPPKVLGPSLDLLR